MPDLHTVGGGANLRKGDVRHAKSLSLSLSIALSVLSALAETALAQVPDRPGTVHPHIAPLAPGYTGTNVATPHFALDDQKWNHGEGFDGINSADWGGWHSFDPATAEVGQNLTINDIHATVGFGYTGSWVSYDWHDDKPPFSITKTYRFVGHLRPAGTGLPTTHPLYGNLGTGSWGTGEYVDQGAFELFIPEPAWSGQRIAIIVRTMHSIEFPADRNGEHFHWRQIYRGFFSPDGLVRDEEPSGTISGFIGNTYPDDVQRLSLEILEEWEANRATANYYPIVVCPVISVMHRSAMLNEQRQLQMARAVKLLLQSSTHPGNPFAPATVAPDDTFVVFMGGSNGGLNASMAAVALPDIVEGCYGPTIGNARGAHGVVGLHVADLLTGSAFPGDELIACTMSGDIIVYDAETMVEIWRTWVDGAAGMFNSIVVADLDGDPHSKNELYVAGSWGLYRFLEQ